MVAHHTVGGCNLRPGDLFGTGTISCKVGCTGLDANLLVQFRILSSLVFTSFSQADKGKGCLLESLQGMKVNENIGDMPSTYLQDGDTIILKGTCISEEKTLGFGECKATLVGSKI